MYEVSGILKKTYIPSVDGYKYSVDYGTKKFKTLEEASAYADQIAKYTGIYVRVK